MSHWRATRGMAERLDARGNEDASYATGWALSGLGTLLAVVLVWQLHL
ncbi:MAG: hypothetical protein JWQ24_113 [Tardiphaga sp.]|nr:hypothetical protein [Tardiphaga sp.]